MLSLLRCEFLKLTRCKMVLISFLGALVTPLMMVVDGIKIHYNNPNATNSLSDLYDGCILYTMLIFGLLVYAVITAYLFSREYTEKTLKLILTIPVTKTKFLVSKFLILLIWILALSFATWTAALVFGAVYNCWFGLSGFSISVCLHYLGKMLLSGILVFITLTPFAFLSLWSKGLIIPVIISAALVMGNAALSNESLGIFFPWTASHMLLSGTLKNCGFPPVIGILLIALTAVVGFLASMIYFKKEDVR